MKPVYLQILVAKQPGLTPEIPDSDTTLTQMDPLSLIGKEWGVREINGDEACALFAWKREGLNKRRDSFSRKS